MENLIKNIKTNIWPTLKELAPFTILLPMRFIFKMIRMQLPKDVNNILAILAIAFFIALFGWNFISSIKQVVSLRNEPWNRERVLATLRAAGWGFASVLLVALLIGILVSLI